MSNDGINPEISNYIESMNRQLEAERNDKLKIQTQLSQIMQFADSKETNLVEYQLSFEKDLNEMYHLLSGHETKTIIENGEQKEIWVEPIDDRLKTFSYYGVKKLIHLLKMYINRNTLLSFYGEEQINFKVREFGIELSDLFNNRYQALLYWPTPEDLYDKYKSIVEKKDLDISEEELYEKCLEWSKEELRAREKLIPIYCISLVNMVHSAYMRAFQGKERQSLGERGINISQNNQNNEANHIPQKKGGVFGFLKN